MGKITVETCDIEGLKIITPTVFGDERGYFPDQLSSGQTGPRGKWRSI